MSYLSTLLENLSDDVIAYCSSTVCVEILDHFPVLDVKIVLCKMKSAKTFSNSV